MKPIFEVKNFGVSYSRYGEPILSGLNWIQNIGEIFQLIGPNGSGKSTVLRALAGDPLVLRWGDVFFNGTQASFRPTEWRRWGIRWVPQINASFAELSVQENLELAAAAESRTNISEALHLFPDLRGLLDRQVQRLSGGEKRMVDLAPLGFTKDASMIWLDEPIAPLSERNSNLFLDFIDERIRTGTAVVIATHKHELNKWSNNKIYLSSNVIS